MWLRSKLVQYTERSMFVDKGDNICDLPPLPLPPKRSTSVPGIVWYRTDACAFFGRPWDQAKKETVYQ